MDWKLLATVFATVFLAELGDKTQLATLLYAAESPGARWLVFAGAAAALVLAAGIGVFAGGWIAQYFSLRHLKLAAGAGFVLIGLWTLRSAWA